MELATGRIGTDDLTLAENPFLGYRATMLTTALVERILDRLPKLTIGLLGDLFLDRYLDIDPTLDEPSVETGLTAYQVTGVRSYPGALGTVLNNLVALGVGKIVPISFVGDDGEGFELKQALKPLSKIDEDNEPPQVDLYYLITTSDRRTPTYCKPMRGKIELNRLDIKNRTKTSPELQSDIVFALNAEFARCNAWIVLDQVSEPDCGVVTESVKNTLAKLADEHERWFTLADSRERIHEFQNVCVKPNEREASTLVPGRAKAIFQTRGEKGIHLTYPGQLPPEGIEIPAYPLSGPIDICGAGDSCSAGITCGVAAGASYVEAAAFGNLIASITVQQIGTTGTATPEQVRARWAEVGGK